VPGNGTGHVISLFHEFNALRRHPVDRYKKWDMRHSSTGTIGFNKLMIPKKMDRRPTVDLSGLVRLYDRRYPVCMDAAGMRDTRFRRAIQHGPQGLGSDHTLKGFLRKPSKPSKRIAPVLFDIVSAHEEDLRSRVDGFQLLKTSSPLMPGIMKSRRTRSIASSRTVQFESLFAREGGQNTIPQRLRICASSRTIVPSSSTIGLSQTRRIQSFCPVHTDEADTSAAETGR